MRIKEFEEYDREELRKLYLEVRRTNFVWLSNEARTAVSFDVDTEGEYILVAWVDDHIAGFTSIWLPDNFIHHLYVADNYQRQGVGAQLLSEAVSRINRPVTLKCMKNNFNAMQFYLKHGWTIQHEGHTEEGPYVLFELIKNNPK